MSGLWGPQTALDLYLQEEGIETLFFSGVNADQVSSYVAFQQRVFFVPSEFDSQPPTAAVRSAF